MILSIDHNHLQQTPKVIQNKSAKITFNADLQTKNYFDQLKSKSESILLDFQIKDIENKRMLIQKKVYANDSSDYLQLLLQNNRAKNIDFVVKELGKKQKMIKKAIKQQKIEISPPKKSIKQINEQIDRDLIILRSKSAMRQLHVDPEIEKRKLKIEQEYEDLNRKERWKVQSEHDKSIKSFISEVKKQKIKREQRIRRYELKQEKKLNQLTQLQSQKKIQQQEKEKETFLKQISLKKDKVTKEKQFNKQKLIQVEQILKKYKTQKPIYVKLEQKFEKQIESAQIERRKQILSDIKLKKRQISLAQIEADRQRYEQVKRNIEEELNAKRQAELAHQQKIKISLKQMHRGHFHQMIQEQNQIVPIDQKAIKKQKIEKMLAYSMRVSMNHRPSIDEAKRLQMQATLQSSMQSQHKIKKTLSDGQVIFEDKEKFIPRELGLMYLHELKLLNNRKERPQKSSKGTSVQAPKQIKIIDHSLLKHDYFRYKVTLSKWKDIVANPKLSDPQKIQQVQQHIKLIEEKALAESIKIKNKNLSKSVDMKQMQAKYQIAKAQAKLALLKMETSSIQEFK